MLDTMWHFMEMGGLKANYPALKEACMKKVDKSEINWRQGEKPMHKAALVHGYQRRGKNIGTMTHGTFDLNFCPVCGTKLEEE